MTPERLEIVGDFWLNEQDPHEPTGVMFWDGTANHDLAKLIAERFALRPGYDGWGNATVRETLCVTVARPEKRPPGDTGVDAVRKQRLFRYLKGWDCGSAFQPIPDGLGEDADFLAGYDKGRLLRAEVKGQAERLYGAKIGTLTLDGTRTDR